MFNLTIYIGDHRLTLYPDENINLNQSVQSLKDLSKVFTDFTKSFRVPADDVNNNIFKHYYDAQIVNGFDARIKQDARIEIGGITLVRGKMQLNNVLVKTNEPVNYSIEFFGETVQIKDTIGDATLRNLDLSAYNHDYNPTTVAQGLTTGLFSRVIKYPLLSYNRRYLWQDVQQDDDDNINIKYDASFTSGLQWTELKPAIKCSAILDQIQTQYGLSFTDDFTQRREFDELYMSLSNGIDDLNRYASQSFNNFQVVVYSVVGNQFNGFSSQHRADVTVTDNTIPYRLVININGQRVFQSSFGNGNRTIIYPVGIATFGSYDVEYFLESSLTLTADIEYRFQVTGNAAFTWQGSQVNEVIFNDTNTIPPVIIDINTVMTDMKIIDWLAGIIKAFNLVIDPLDDGSLLLNDLPSWYNSGQIIDITNHVDISTINVERGRLYRQIDFAYEDQESLLANEYENIFGQQFGGFRNTITGIATDEELEIKLPFENPQFERLQPSNAQYGFIVDKDLNGYSNKPFLMYIPRVDLDEPLGFSGNTYAPLGTVNLPSHAIDFNSGFAPQFNAEFNEQNGILLADNLYSRYWSDYLNDLFNTQRRQYTINANLPITLSSKLRLNDRIVIKDTRYIIDNMSTNLLTGVTKFTLLNDIFESFNNPNQSNVSQQSGTFTESGSVYYTGASLAVVSTDTEWITLNTTSVGNGETITFTLDYNGTGESRIGQIKIQDNLSNPTIIVEQIKPLVLE